MDCEEKREGEGRENRRNGERGSLPFALHCIMGFERIKGKGGTGEGKAGKGIIWT